MPFLVPTNPVVTVSGTIPVISTGGVTPVISIQDSTIEQKGAVQLEDSISSDSVTKAATPKSVKEVHDYATTISGSLQTDIDGKSDVGHDHDDRYYLESEVDALITPYVPIETSGDFIIPTGKCFAGGDEFSVIGADVLSIEGTGRMILVG